MAVFRVEKTRDYTVMSNHHLRDRNLSLKAKGLLSLMLSLPEDWDYTTKGLAAISKDGVDGIRAALKELEAQGYLRRERVRNEQGQVGATLYTIFETPNGYERQPEPPKPEKPEQEKPEQEKPVQANPSQANPEQEKPAQDFPAQLNTKELNTKGQSIHQSIIDLSIYPDGMCRMDEADGMDEMDVYRELIQGNINYDDLLRSYTDGEVDEVVEIMLEAVCSDEERIRVAGRERPAPEVRKRLLSLNQDHVEYVFDCISRNTHHIRDMSSYLLTALYKAPTTMNNFYRSEVARVMRGGSCR